MEKGLLEKISAFWVWFVEEQKCIENVVSERDVTQRDRIVEGFDQHLLPLGQIKWVLEEKEPGMYTLTCSPNSTREVYVITKSIMEIAPSLPNWSFYDAIQPTGEWTLQLYDMQMDILSFDLRQWKASAEKEPNGKYFLEVEMDQFLTDEDLETVAVDLALNALLGEGPKLNYLSGFDVVEKSKENFASFQEVCDQILGIKS